MYCKVIDKKGRQAYNDQHEQGRSSEEGRVSGSEACFPLMNALTFWSDHDTKGEEAMLREGQVRIPSGCAVSGIFAKDGRRLSGEAIIKSISIMHDRSNGLGGGFAGYGIYPEYKEHYAFHVFYDDKAAKEACENFIDSHFDVVNLSKIPVRKTDEPLIWRYFVNPLPTKLKDSQLDEREYTARCVMRINTRIEGAYVFSSGKNMGVFKAVGYPEDVGDFYRLEVPYQYARLVGRRPSLRYAGLFSGA